MTHKKQMIQLLLESYDEISRASPSDQPALYYSWKQQVASALAAAGMDNEARAWREANEAWNEGTDPSYMKSMKAVLLGILSKLESES